MHEAWHRKQQLASECLPQQKQRPSASLRERWILVKHVQESFDELFRWLNTGKAREACIGYLLTSNE